jgi:tetratricopeptide (TPR) repeat protein
MSQYRCPNCDILFDPPEGKLRCPKCLRQHGLEEVGASPPSRAPRVSRRHLLHALLVLFAVVLIVVGALLFSRSRAVPRPGQIGVLEPALLRRTLIWRGVPEAQVVDPFASSTELRQLARQAAAPLAVARTSDPQLATRAAELARKLELTRDGLRADLDATADTPVRTPDALFAELRAGKARAALSFEVAALVVTALREAGGQAILGQINRVDAPVRTPDPVGGVGRYVAVLYAKGRLGGDPLLVLDPLRALALPAWAGGGKDPEMKAVRDELVLLDDASAGGHLLALRGLRARRKQPPQAYELSQLALKAAAPSSTLHGARAIVLASAGGTEDAVAEGKKALALRDDASTRCALGKLLAAAGRAAEAKPHLEEALRRDPSYWPALQILSALLLPVEPEQGVKHLEAAQRIAPDEPALQILQALRELQQNDTDEAITRLRQVMSRQPSPQAGLLLYQALAMAGKTDELAPLRKQLLAQTEQRAELERTLQAIDDKLKAAREAPPASDGEDTEKPPQSPRVPQLKLPDVKLK